MNGAMDLEEFQLKESNKVPYIKVENVGLYDLISLFLKV